MSPHSQKPSIEELVVFIASALVEEPEQIQVSARDGYRSVNIRLEVAQEDMGRVIGKGGRVANAIRDVLTAATLHEDRQVNLKIM